MKMVFYKKTNGFESFGDRARSMSCGKRDLRALGIIAVPFCSRSLKRGRFVSGIMGSSSVYTLFQRFQGTADNQGCLLKAAWTPFFLLSSWRVSYITAKDSH